MPQQAGSFQKVLICLAKQLALWSSFLFVWLMYRVLRRRSMRTRFKVTRVIFHLVYWLWEGGRERMRRNLSIIRPDLYGRWSLIAPLLPSQKYCA